MEINNSMPNLKTKSEITPTEYFENVKSLKNMLDDEKLKKMYENSITLFEKYKKTGQTSSMRKLIFYIETIQKEREILAAGIDTFVYTDDVSRFLEKVENKVVKIIELDKFPREIPDEIVDIIDKHGNKFDKLYVLFTDYTGETEKEIEKERRDKDPILFGAFEDKSNDSKYVVKDRLYYLGDWIDEYCDLTLQQIVEVMQKDNVDVIRKIKMPDSIEELTQIVDNYEKNKDKKLNLDDLKNGMADLKTINVEFNQNSESNFKPIKTLFSKIKTFLNK